MAAKRKTTFYTFDEAVDVAKEDPSVELLGLKLRDRPTSLAAYSMQACETDGDVVRMFYRESEFFSSSSQEDLFDACDADDDARETLYAKRSELPGADCFIENLPSERLLAKVIPGLDCPSKFDSGTEFISSAKKAFKAFWPMPE